MEKKEFVDRISKLAERFDSLAFFLSLVRDVAESDGYNLDKIREKDVEGFESAVRDAEDKILGFFDRFDEDYNI